MTTVGIGLALVLSHTKRESLPTSVSAAILRPRAAAGPGLGKRIARDVETMLGALNSVRVANGLSALVLDPTLCAIARSHGDDMAHRNYFDHTSPEGVSPFDRLARARYRYGYAGENLALDSDPISAERALFASAEHRNNMLEAHYLRVGIAAVPSPSGEIFVEDFSD